jgi:predicted Holliday junction resolvase-like endonuclease
MRTDTANLINLIASAVAILFLVLYFVVRAQVVSLKAEISTLRSNVPALAQQQFDRWKGEHVENVRLQEVGAAHREAMVQLQQWRSETEATIRQDAIQRSQAVITGKVTEHLIPLMPVFPYNPKDARFLGSPVDLIVFDGADEGDLRRIILLEIKTGAGDLTTRQRQIRDAVQAGRITWQVMRV